MINNSKMRFIFPLGLLLCFFLDGSLFQLYSYTALSNYVTLVPYLTVLWLIMAVYFEHTLKLHLAWWAFGIGIFYDLYYSGILGVYMFVFPLVVLLSKTLVSSFPSIFSVALLIYAIDIMIIIFMSYIAGEAAKMIAISLGDYLLKNALPTFILNIVLFLFLYNPVSSLYRKYG